jgi:molybdopterin-binding protein
MEAARLAGVSHLTMRQWVYKKKIHTTKTARGHYRISRAEIERLSERREPGRKRGKPINLTAISRRNNLHGSISRVRFHGSLTEVTIDVGGQQITSVIRSDESLALGLETGMSVEIRVRATKLRVIRGNSNDGPPNSIGA